MGKVQLVVSALLLVLLLAACAPKAAPAPQAPAAPAPAAAPLPAAPAPAAVSAPAKPAWQTEWEKVVAAAKQEGRVSLVLGSFAQSVRFALVQGFKGAYGIPAESVSAKGSELANKVLSQRRAGIYSYDICILGPGQITMLKPGGAQDPLEPLLILPEVTDPELIKKTWRGGKLWWVDSDHTVLATAVRINYPIAINTNLVKEGEIKSWRDLLNPKWKGKIILGEPTTGGSGGNFLAFVDAVLGWDYLVELLQKAEPVVLKDERLELDWLVHGKVALTVLPEHTTLIELMAVGAPIKGLVPAEGTWVSSGGASCISVFNKRPHPNAAKLFFNWFLSKEGQNTLAVPLGAESHRLDVPVDHVPADMRLKEGMKYFDVQDEKVMLTGPALQKKATELLRSLTAK